MAGKKKSRIEAGKFLIRFCKLCFHRGNDCQILKKGRIKVWEIMREKKFLKKKFGKSKFLKKSLEGKKTKSFYVEMFLFLVLKFCKAE